METKKYVISHFFSGLLTLVFLFPSILQFEHLFESHEHKVCKENTVHIHQKNLDCSIYDFHFSAFNFQLISHNVSAAQKADLLRPSCKDEKIVKTTRYYPTLRGPPSNLDFNV